MADISALERALRNADAAGDTAAATKLAQAIKAARGGEPSQPDLSQSLALPDVNLRKARAEGNRREYENLPGWQKPIVALDDIVSLLGEGASYGYGTKLAATLRSKVKGTNYEDERAAMNRQLDNARDRAGLAGTGAEIAGAVYGPMKLAGRGVTATRIPKIGGPLGLTIDSSIMGAVDAGGHDADPVSGALWGGAFGAAAQAGGKVLEKVISPFKGSPERTKAAQYLRGEGVDVTAGQKTGSKNLRYAEGEMGGGAAQDFMEKQGEQFTAAALKRTGTQANRATADVLNDAFDRIGGDFDRLAARNNLIADPQIAQDLTRVAVDYGSVVAPSMRAPVVEKTIRDTLSVLQSQGGMAGRAYQQHASRLRTLARNTKDNDLREAINGIVEALDSAMERSIQRANPSDLGAWGQTRRQYRNLMVVEQAATGAGENAAAGLISPSGLRNATVSKHGRRNYARGKGDFAELARSGEAVLKPLPDSGTSARLRAWAPHAVGVGVGAGAGGSEGGYEGALIGAGAGAVAPYAIGRVLLSGPGRAYLGNQAASRVSPQTRAMIARLLATAGATGAVTQSQ